MPKHDPNFSKEKEKYGTPIASREFILNLINEAQSPLGFTELVKLCHINSEELKFALKKRLRAMERDGQLLYNKHNKYEQPDTSSFVVGEVIGHKDGFGFLQLDGSKPGKNDWYISQSQMRSLIHGDRIMAQPVGEFKGKTEARIVKIIEPRTAPIVGRYFVEFGVQLVIPDDSRIQQEIIIPQGKELGARHGHMVVVELETRPSKRSSAVGFIKEVLGEHMSAGMEIEVALRKHEIPFEWPKAVERFAERLPSEVQEQDKVGRVDLRNLPLVTIDGETSRDFDDAVYCEPKKSGGWRLFVAIADVSHYVKYGSALDKEAINRGNSVYFPDQVVPMLPEQLSNGLCSLNPMVDRLCMVCEMSIEESGKLTDFKFYEGVMYSHARLTYTKVAAMLDGDVELQNKYQEIFPHVVNLYELFKQLKQMRAQRGAFEFETVEPKFIFNAQRKIDSVETVERNDAHKIIEECMILANVSAAKMLEKHDAGGLFRVHDKPDPSKLANFRSYLAEMGAELTFSNEPSPKELSEQINDYLSRPDGELIQTMMIRSMRQAVYQPDNIGHFGLALDGYAHFTSPIRRYPDLVVHRAIKGILKSQGQKPSGYKVYDDEELDELGEQCSKTERRADEATREVEAWLKCEFMLDHIDNEYEGVVSSVTSFGMFVRLKELHIEGLVHIAALGNDFFHYDSEKHLLVGERTRRTYRLGDDVTIRVANVSLDDKQIDFELASQPKGKRNQSDDGDSGRRKANISRTDNAAMSVREQLRKGHVPGKQKEAKVDKKTSGKKAKESLKKGKRKPKSRAAKRIAKKKSTNTKKKK